MSVWPITSILGPFRTFDARHEYQQGETDMAFNGDTKMGVMLDDAAARAVLVKFLPEINTAGPMLNLARGMSLKQVAGFPQAKISKEKLQAIVTELEKL